MLVCCFADAGNIRDIFLPLLFPGHDFDGHPTIPWSTESNLEITHHETSSAAHE